MTPSAPLAAADQSVAGPLALLLVLLLAVATVLLVRNMAARIKRLPPSFPDPTGGQSGPDAGSDAGPAAGREADPAAGPDARPEPPG